MARCLTALNVWEVFPASLEVLSAVLEAFPITLEMFPATRVAFPSQALLLIIPQMQIPAGTEDSVPKPTGTKPNVVFTFHLTGGLLSYQLSCYCNA